MIKEYNFKARGTTRALDRCMLMLNVVARKKPNRDWCSYSGEDNCVLYQIYKQNLPKCGICGKVYTGDFDWNKYMGDINFFMENINPPLCDKCYKQLIKDRNYDG